MISNRYSKNRESMADEKIIDLYWARNEKAIEETDFKYGKYLYTISYNILHNHLDSESVQNLYLI